jgi:hypothetical protein
MEIKTLSDFKRFLANGGKIQLIDVDGKAPAEKIAHIRQVEKMQTNSCKFEGGSWLFRWRQLVAIIPRFLSCFVHGLSWSRVQVVTRGF